LTIANQVDPMIAPRIDADVAQGDANQLACSESRWISKVQQKSQALCGIHLPPIRPLEAVGDGAEVGPHFGVHKRMLAAKLDAAPGYPLT
jgi:hypothetical protein